MDRQFGLCIPTLCSNFDFGDKEIIFHSENGVIGYGPLAAPGKEDLHLVNAGGQHVTPRPGAAIVHHANSFALIRGGRIDVTVLGAYEVAENGDFANWKISRRAKGCHGVQPDHPEGGAARPHGVIQQLLTQATVSSAAMVWLTAGALLAADNVNYTDLFHARAIQC